MNTSEFSFFVLEIKFYGNSESKENDLRVYHVSLMRAPEEFVATSMSLFVTACHLREAQRDLAGRLVLPHTGVSALGGCRWE